MGSSLLLKLLCTYKSNHGDTAAKLFNLYFIVLHLKLNEKLLRAIWHWMINTYPNNSLIITNYYLFFHFFVSNDFLRFLKICKTFQNSLTKSKTFRSSLCHFFVAISYCASFTKWLGYFVWHFHCAVDIKHQRNAANKRNYLWANMLQNYCLNAKINLTSSQNFVRSVLQGTLTFTFGTFGEKKA